MPTYEYEACDSRRSCARCIDGFDLIRSLRDPPVVECPDCGAPVRKRMAAPSIGRSISSLDNRAKAAGFSKLKRLGKGEYEKQY